MPEQHYDQVKQRLDEILREVGDQDLSLDAALDLYEEAVKLGMSASQQIESETFAALHQPADQEEEVDTASSDGVPAA